MGLLQGSLLLLAKSQLLVQIVDLELVVVGTGTDGEDVLSQLGDLLVDLSQLVLLQVELGLHSKEVGLSDRG